MAASQWAVPSARAAAAAAVDVVDVTATPGRFVANHWRVCASACGWVPTRRTSSSVVPGAATRENVTGRTASPMTVRGAPLASSSRVWATAPSTEFSTGTMDAETSPSRTPAMAAATPA